MKGIQWSKCAVVNTLLSAPVKHGDGHVNMSKATKNAFPSFFAVSRWPRFRRSTAVPPDTYIHARWHAPRRRKHVLLIAGADGLEETLLDEEASDVKVPEHTDQMHSRTRCDIVSISVLTEDDTQQHAACLLFIVNQPGFLCWFPWWRYFCELYSSKKKEANRQMKHKATQLHWEHLPNVGASPAVTFKVLEKSLLGTLVLFEWHLAEGNHIVIIFFCSWKAFSEKFEQ